jgi:hypothetical protein
MPGYPGTLAELAGFRGRCQGLGGYPGAEALRDSLWTLPVHSRMRAEDLAEVGRWVGEGGEEPWVNRKGRRAKGSGFGAEGIRLR